MYAAKGTPKKLVDLASRCILPWATLDGKQVCDGDLSGDVCTDAPRRVHPLTG